MEIQYHLSVPGSGTTNLLSVVRCYLHQTSRPRLRQRGAYAMWTTLFIVVFLTSIALGLTGIIINSANGGKFRL